MLIAIEGIDASGKATQTEKLAFRLHGASFSFPDYSTPFGQIIKEHLAGDWSARDNNPDVYLKTDSRNAANARDNMVFQACMLANKAEVVPNIRRALKSRHVVCDRYWASALAYGEADGLDPQQLHNIQSWMPAADLNILLVVNVEESFKRRPDRRDRYERLGVDYLTEVQENYINLWHESAKRGRYIIIDGTPSADSVHESIWEWVAALLPAIIDASSPVSVSDRIVPRHADGASNG